MALSDDLTAIRDGAALNQNSLGIIADEALANFESVRTWADGPIKLSVMRELGGAVVSYRNAQREAIELRNAADEALSSILGDAAPALPDTGTTALWSYEEW